MKHKLYFLTLLLFFIAPSLALPADKTVIVGFHKPPRNSEKALIQGAKGIIKRTYNLIPAMAVTLPEQAIENLHQSPHVAYVESNAIFTATDEYDDSWGVEHIGADLVHTSGNKGTGVKIAVIDTGIDYNHPDLDANYAGGWDYIYNDAFPYDDSTNSHGTHVAGILSAEENGTGVIGVAPEAEIYAVKVLDSDGYGTLEGVIAGIEWAANNGMDIANLSLEGPTSQPLQNACAQAFNAGVLLVAAGGNTSGGAVKYPGGYSSVIAVTAVNAFNQKASFSPLGSALELSAPGVNILSTITGGGYGMKSGTSMAAPYVAGTAALFFLTDPVDENNNGMIHDEVREMLQLTAIDLGVPGRDNTFGFGLVNPVPFNPCDCEGNFDADSDVDGTDSTIFKADFGRNNYSNPCETTNPCAGDFDCDGDVDGNDASVFTEDFGRNAFTHPCLPDCMVEECNY